VLLLEEHAQVGELVHCTGIISFETAALAKIPDEIVLGRLQRARLVSPVGAAGGFTKPTTGGGIYYSLLTASLAADTLIEGFQAGRRSTPSSWRATKAAGRLSSAPTCASPPGSGSS
jgi:hypothetical protein